MSFPTPGYLTRRASASPSLVLLVFLQSVSTDQSQQLSHDRLAIAVPVDATVAQLQSLIEQRYQQLLSEDEEDGDSTHRIVVRRVYKVAEFAYVVSRHEVVGEVFANEEQLQADVSVRTDREKQRQHRDEESKESDEKQWDDDKAEGTHTMDDGSDSLPTPTLPLRSTSLTTRQQPITPTRHSSRTSQHSQSRISPAIDRSTLTSQQRLSQSEIEEKDDSKHGAALEEVEGSKKVNRQLVQLLNAPKSTAHSHARDDDAPAVTDVTEQKAGRNEARVEEEQEEKEDVGEATQQRQRRSSSSAEGDYADDAMVDAREGSVLNGDRENDTEETKEQQGNENRAAQAERMSEEKRMEETDERKRSDNTSARSVRSARPSAFIAADSSITSALPEKKKRGRKRKNVEAAAPPTLTTPHPPAPASSSSSSAASSTTSSSSSTTASVSLSATHPVSSLPAGPSDIRCVLCGQGGGVLKQAIRSKKAAPEWCHQMCATWCDGTYFSWNNHRVYNINVALDRTKRKHLQCRLCQQPVGATAPVQCVDDDCDEAFHITCGVAHNYQTFEAEPDEEAKRRGMQEEFVAACPRHNNPKYDEKNDDGCCICLYTRPSQPEMSAKLTCVECGVRVHRTCYYNLPSDSVNGEVSAAVSGQIDWQRWTCMCCEYKQKGVYYWVSESNKVGRAKKQDVRDRHRDTSDSRKGSGMNGQRAKSAQATASSKEKARTGRSKRRKEEEELRNKEAHGEEERNDMDEEKQEVGAEDVVEEAEEKYVEEQESKEGTHDDASEQAPSTDVARANGRSGTRSAKRGSGTSKKRQKTRQEVILRTGFDGRGASEGTELPSHTQDGEVDGGEGESDVAMNGAAAADTDEEKTPSHQQRLTPPSRSPVNNCAAAVLKSTSRSPVNNCAAAVLKSPLLPMAAHLDARHAAAIRRLEENATREKRVARSAMTTAQQTAGSRSTRDERAARSSSTSRGQQQHRSSSNGLIINTIRASTSAASLSQPATSSPSSTPVSPPRSTLSRKEYIHAISRYSALTLTAVLHHHGLNYTGNKEGQVARLMATMAQLPTEDERRQWEQAWERDAGEDKDKPMLRMPDREFEQHRQTGSASRSRAQTGGVQAAVAGFGPTREVQRLTQSAGLAEAVEEENMEEEEVDELEEDDTEDEEDEVQDGDEQSDGEKLQKAIDAIEEIEDSNDESRTDEPPTAHQRGKVAATTSRGRGGGRGRGRGGRGRGASQVNGMQSKAANGNAVKQVNGHVNGGGRGRGRGRGRQKGRA